MKRCPTCQQTFSDPSLSFCIEDGTPLVPVPAPAPDPEATIVAGSTRHETNPGDAENAPPSWQTPPYQPPGQFVSPPVKRRRAWPWVLGIVVLLLLGVAGLGIAAVIVIPNLIHEAGKNENTSQVNTNTSGNLNDNRNANGNSNANTNSFGSNENTNQNSNTNNSNAGSPTDAPTDPDAVLADLTALEKEWTEANFSADKRTLARILADDFVGTDPSGTIQGKADYLRDIKPEKVSNWEFRDLKLTLKGDRATLKGKMHLQREDDDEPIILQFTDKFVWRDDRWQAVASEVSRANAS